MNFERIVNSCQHLQVPETSFKIHPFTNQFFNGIFFIIHAYCLCKGARKNKCMLLSGHVFAEALTTPPPTIAVSGHTDFLRFFHMHKMFLKQERSEMDNFEEEKKLVAKEKYQYFKKILEIFSNGYPCFFFTK